MPPMGPKDFHYYFAIDAGDYYRFEKYWKGQALLTSFATLDEKGRDPEKEHRFLTALKGHDGLVMVDSGGFTNFTKPGTVQFDDWLKFMKAHKGWVDEYVTFDDLRSRAKTVGHYEKARAAGLNPIFVDHLWFRHTPEVEKVWEREQKVAVSGFAKTLPGQENAGVAPMDRLAKAFERGRAHKTFTHMLAVGSIRKYLGDFDRVHSVDSTAFDKSAAYGSTLVYMMGEYRGFNVPLLKGFNYPEAQNQHRPLPDDLKRVYDKTAKSHGVDKVSPNTRAKILSILAIKKYIKAIREMDHGAFKKHLDEAEKAVKKAVLEGDEWERTWMPDPDELDDTATDFGWTVTGEDLDRASMFLGAPVDVAKGAAVTPAKLRELLTVYGPPVEWSGAVASVIGPKLRRELAAAWEAMPTTERDEVQATWEAAMAKAADPDPSAEEDPEEDQSHLTAISRSTLSAPMKALRDLGLLRGSVLDFGSGRGDDVKALRAAGMSAQGWDPHYADDKPPAPADVVNLGFVLNVVEDPAERRKTLARAWKLAGKTLAVAVRVDPIEGKPKGDGVVTSAGTFQKPYTSEELVEYVTEVTGTDAKLVAPGIVVVRRQTQKADTFGTFPIFKAGPSGGYVLGIVLEPTDAKAGLKPDSQADVYSEEDVREAFEWYCQFGGNIRLMHKGRPLVMGKDVQLLDNYTTIGPMDVDGEHVRKGTWLMGVAVLDEELRADIRSRELTGFSIGGTGRRLPVRTQS